jgi:uncharacterized RDD family membrane protein YckC
MLAEPMERLAARLIDVVVWLGIAVIASAVSYTVFGRTDTHEAGSGIGVQTISPVTAWLAFLGMLGTLFLYEVPATARTGGHFSKRRFQLSVAGPDGGAPSFGRPTVRWLVLWLPPTAALLFFTATIGTSLGLVALAAEAAAVALPAIAFLRDDKRGVHDLLAGTSVLTTR